MWGLGELMNAGPARHQLSVHQVEICCHQSQSGLRQKQVCSRSDRCEWSQVLAQSPLQREVPDTRSPLVKVDIQNYNNYGFKYKNWLTDKTGMGPFYSGSIHKGALNRMTNEKQATQNSMRWLMQQQYTVESCMWCKFIQCNYTQPTNN